MEVAVIHFLNNDLEGTGDLLVYCFYRGVPVCNMIVVSTSINYTCCEFQL